MSLEILGNTIGGLAGGKGVPQKENFATSPTSRGFSIISGSPTYGSDGATLDGSFEIGMDTIRAKEFVTVTMRGDGVVNSVLALKESGTRKSFVESSYGTGEQSFTCTAVNMKDGTWRTTMAGFTIGPGTRYNGEFAVSSFNLTGAGKFSFEFERQDSWGDGYLVGITWL